MKGLATHSTTRSGVRLLGRPEVQLTALFVGSRYLLHQSGVVIQRLPLEGSWQLIDPALLQHDLLRSLLHLHSQPPLYNLLVGTLLKLTPDADAAARTLDTIYTALGLLLVLLMYRLMRRLGVAPSVALAAAALFSLSPAAILYENYPFYTFPAAVLVCVCASLFERTVSAFTPARALALFTALAALIYLRSLFQIGWFLTLWLFCGWVLAEHRRVIALAGALPLLLVAALYAGNAAVTGHFTTSSWLGMSLAKLTTMQLPLPERRALVATGVLSPLALQQPFSAPEEYPQHLAATPVTGVPVLDQTRKSSGRINFNHAAYPAISGQYLDDALIVLARHPTLYLDSLRRTHLMYFRPSADYPFLHENRTHIKPLVRSYNHLIAGQPVYTDEPGFGLRGPGEVGWLIAIGFVLCVCFGGAAMWRCLRGCRKPDHGDAVVAFLWLNIVYVTMFGNALEMDENQRFRFLINPLLVVTLAAIVTHGSRTRRDHHE